jgi:mono/diheme cytochrome c family protein
MRSLALALATLTPLAAACAGEIDTGVPEPDTISDLQSLSAEAEHGREVWFNNTYGGEKFFAFLKQHPDPQRRIDIGFTNVTHTPRSQRFDVWGVINDPDCVADPAGGEDLCADPESSGVIGIRKKTLPNGAVLYGATCASCHAGFDPLRPPDDPNEPRWENVHATIGNQYLQIGKVFAANLAPTDPRGLIFAAWPPGSVDTTLLFDDGIMNPGVITHFWEHKHRPTFDVGMAEPQMRNGQGGEDDVGGDLAALRVYTNIGTCFAECVAPAVQQGRPISIAECEQTCPDWPPQQDLDDMGVFLATHKAPRYPGLRAPLLSLAGRTVFDANCASCHSRAGSLKHVLSNDEVNAIAADPLNATNVCRTLGSNWETGKLWAEFSSQLYKDRTAAGGRGYRSMPLAGIWATSPLLHNQSIGRAPPADAAPWERAAYYWEAMWELLSAERAPVVHRSPVQVGPFPPGTPLRIIFSTDPATGQVLCNDVVENKGHYYGAHLSDLEKVALIYWLKYQ